MGFPPQLIPLAQAVRVKIESPGDPSSQLKGGGGASGGKGDLWGLFGLALDHWDEPTQYF